MIDYLIYFIIFICIFLVVKNIRTYDVRSKVATAICQYRIDNDVSVSYWINTDRMEDYNKTLFRFWDWGYKRIVPKEIYNRIKDYIK
jgi:hypothetical protein